MGKTDKKHRKAVEDVENPELSLDTGEAILLVMVRQANALDSIADNLKSLTRHEVDSKPKRRRWVESGWDGGS